MHLSVSIFLSTLHTIYLSVYLSTYLSIYPSLHLLLVKRLRSSRADNALEQIHTVIVGVLLEKGHSSYLYDRA